PSFGGQTGGRFRHAAPAQGLSHRRGERCQLQEVPFLEFWVRRNDRLALPGQLSALFEERTNTLEGAGYRLQRWNGGRRIGKRAHQCLAHRRLAPEQDLALVGEVAEERALRQTGARRYLRHRGLVEPALAVERERGALKSAAAVWLPSTHSVIL